MELNTELSLQGIITSPIPNREKQAVLQAIKDKLTARLEWLNEVISEGTPKKGELEDQIDMIDRIIAKYVTYDC